ncbi:hypothetical protein [Cytobacillus kochii]|uniref:hypothetical protein n=1 Tax=Cytobacillus kochii TaxID=859143 RepID=UPI0024804DC2|nr:hypothetical protein [Cytobacillus kochii]
MLIAEQESRYDEYERQASIAIMNEAAHRAKRPKASDLFKRPEEGVKEETLKKKAEKAEETVEWLSQFDFSKKGGN